MADLEDRVGRGDSIAGYDLARIKCVFSIGDPKSNRSSNLDILLAEATESNMELIGAMSKADLSEVWTQAYINNATDFDVSTLSYVDKQSAFFKFQAMNSQNVVTKEFVIPYYDTSRNLVQDAEALLDLVRFTTNDDAGVTQRKVLKATLIRQI